MRFVITRVFDALFGKSSGRGTTRRGGGRSPKAP